MWGLSEPGAKLLDQPRFAEAGLADDQRELPLAAARALPAAHKDVEFLGAADQRRRRARAASPAAAAGAHDAVELRLFGHALQLMLPLSSATNSPAICRCTPSVIHISPGA